MGPVERFLSDVRDVRLSGEGVSELSYYPALRTLLEDVGGGLKPKVRCVMNIRNRGAASRGLISPSDAWNLHCSIERERRRAVLSPDDVHKPVLMACIDQFKRVNEKQGNPDWPMILAARGLDDLVVWTRKNT